MARIILILATIAAVAAVVGTSATTASANYGVGGCTYKTGAFYLNVRTSGPYSSVLKKYACNLFRQSTNGRLAYSWENWGTARCAWRMNAGSGILLTAVVFTHTRSDGTFGCGYMGTELRGSEWHRIW